MPVMRTSNETADPCPLNRAAPAATLTGDMAPRTQTVPGVAEPNQAYVESPKGAGGRISLWIIRLMGQVRRQYLGRLRPGYVERIKAERQGECRRCGACCNLTFHCPFYVPGTGCRIYEKRTLTCRAFPIDAADLKLTRVPCGHHYERPAEDGARANSAR